MAVDRKHLLACLAAALVVMVGCGGGHGPQSTGPRIIPVETTVATDTFVSPRLRLAGTVESWRRSALGSEIPGRIVALNCDVGDVVAKDSLLVILSCETLIQSRAQYDAVATDWERIKTLRADGAVSQQTYDQTRAAFDAARAAYEKTRNSTRIRGPFRGVVTRKYLNDGEVYTLMPGPAGSPAIIELMQIDTVKVRVAVSEQEYERLALEQRATLALDAFPDTEFVGTVSRIHPTIETKTRTADVEVRFANPGNIIKPGMFGLVSLSLPPRNTLVIDRDALIRQEGTGALYTYKVSGDSVLRADVVTGDDYGGWVEIIAGLQHGDTVVTTGKMNLDRGARVRVSVAGSRQ